MSLIEAFKSRRKAQQNEIAANRAQLWREYRTILGRQESPKPKDVDRLVELLGQLGIEERHVELHAVVLAEASRLEAAVAASGERQAGLAATEARLRSLQSRIDKLRSEIRPLAEELEVARASVSQAEAQIEATELLKQQYAGLLTGFDGPEPERMTGATPAVQNARIRLGLA